MSTDVTLAEAASTESTNAATTTAPPRIWTVFAAWFLAAMLGQFAVLATVITTGVVIGVVLGVQGLDPNEIRVRAETFVRQPVPLMLLTLLPFQLGLGFTVWAIARRSNEPWHVRLGLVPPTGDPLSTWQSARLAAFTVAAALAVLVGTTLLFGLAPVNATGATVSTGSWWVVALLGVVLSLLPAVVEETVFRGYIQRRLLQRWSPAAAIGVSTLLFAILHADSLQHILAVVPLGVVTGLLAYRTNSVKPGMLVHAIHNASAVALGALIRALTPTIGDSGAGLLVFGAILVLGVLGLPAAVALWRGTRAVPNALPEVPPQPALGSIAGPAL